MNSSNLENRLNKMRTIVHLEGQPVIDHSSYVEDSLDCEQQINKFNHIVLDNLYEDFAKLVAVKYINPDYIHIKTSGLYKEKIDILIDLFESLEYIPKSIIFYNENSAMTLLGLARELKEKGTKFYYLYDDGLQEISWI